MVTLAIPFAINLGSVAVILRQCGFASCNQRAHGPPMFAIPTPDVCRSLQLACKHAPGSCEALLPTKDPPIWPAACPANTTLWPRRWPHRATQAQCPAPQGPPEQDHEGPRRSDRTIASAPPDAGAIAAWSPCRSSRTGIAFKKTSRITRVRPRRRNAGRQNCQIQKRQPLRHRNALKSGDKNSRLRAGCLFRPAQPPPAETPQIRRPLRP